MEHRHLVLLRELRDRGSVAAVAEAGFRTASAVSQQLRSAERDLGVALVRPHGRGVRLTDEALLLADAASDVETALERAQARLDEFRGAVAGRVRLAALPSAAEYLVPLVLAALADEPIDIELDDVDVSEEDFAQLATDYDVVVGHTMRARPPLRQGLSVQPVVREPLDVVVGAGHRWSRRRTLRPAEVIREPWIAPPRGYPFRTLVDTIERVTGERADVRHEVRDNRVVEALVVAGEGIALLPRFTTRPRADVRLLQLRDIDSARLVVAMSRRDRAERAVVRRVVAELQRAGAQVARDRSA
ncbi:LysR family transcriptional regulator [Barrientosiimonas humi]|uniref:LysR family transcriptional regulator n=1 Tax=Barrientosiimonas humi TaxID=999931 RepID=UPI00370D59B1